MGCPASTGHELEFRVLMLRGRFRLSTVQLHVCACWGKQAEQEDRQAVEGVTQQCVSHVLRCYGRGRRGSRRGHLKGVTGQCQTNKRQSICVLLYTFVNLG